MKTITYIFNKVLVFRFFLLLIPFILTSCEDWLDVRPKSQIKEKDFFEDEDGFRDALLGIYTIMAQTDLYGGEATMGFLDVISQQYSSVGYNYRQALQYNYEDQTCKTYTDAIWSRAYKGVANCNYILKNLQETGSSLPDSLRQIIKGETLAARAYLLFDMIRAYAPSYKLGANQKAVPLVRTVSNSPVKLLSVAESLDQLVNDLKEAREIIKEVDPIGPAFSTYSEQKTYNTNEYLADDGFMLFRTSRFNYYGITALLARICLYKEEMSAALQYSLEVINSNRFSFSNDQTLMEDDSWYPHLNFGTVAESVAHHEYITSLYIYDLKKSHNDLYFTDNQGALTISSDRKMDVFGGDGLDFDFRARRFFVVPSGNVNEYINKYMTGTQVPLLKLGEMYLIAAEASGDIEYLKTFRRLRGYTGNPLPEGDDLTTELRKEYQREFIGEGQLFYYYKRVNYSQIPYTTIPTTQKIYVFSQPDDEIEFGYINN